MPIIVRFLLNLEPAAPRRLTAERSGKPLIPLAVGILIALFLAGCASTVQPNSRPISSPAAQASKTSIPIFPPALTRTPQPTRMIPEVSGRLRDAISLFLKEMPAAANHAYVVPTKAEQADFANLVTSLQSGSEQVGKSLAV